MPLKNPCKNAFAPLLFPSIIAGTDTVSGLFNFISVNATKALINTSDLISGNYLLKITFDSGLSIEHKIIVQ